MLEPSSAAVPLSPASRDKQGRTQSTIRIPRMSLLVLALLVLLATPSRFGSLVAAGGDDYYGDAQTDDLGDFVWDENLSFSDVSVLPVSCIN